MIVYKVSSELICANYDHIYVPIILYCVRAFVAVLQKLNCLQNIQYASAHLHMKIYSQSFVLNASLVNELYMRVELNNNNNDINNKYCKNSFIQF